MSSNDITAWIEGVREGDSRAVGQLWAEYFEKLTRVARRQLEGARRAVVDEEDVALSAFKSFCVAARDGRLKPLLDRDSLWPLLVSIAANKSVDAIRYENRQKRGGDGGVKNHAATRADGEFSADEFLARDPSPAFATELSDQFHTLLVRLDATGDDQLSKIALAKFEGASTNEIASDLDCARRTVERKLTLIRRLMTVSGQEAADG